MVSPVFCFGGFLWDILPSGMLPGGAPMNVTYHLKKLGVETALISRVGLDDEGEKLIQLMEKNKIATDYFQIDYDLPTGRVMATVKENNEVVYDIIKPVAWDNIRWEESLALLVPASKYFIYG